MTGQTSAAQVSPSDAAVRMTAVLIGNRTKTTRWRLARTICAMELPWLRSSSVTFVLLSDEDWLSRVILVAVPMIPKLELPMRHRRSAAGISARQAPLLTCYHCSGRTADCGVKPSTARPECRACLVYLNAFDNSKLFSWTPHCPMLL